MKAMLHYKWFRTSILILRASHSPSFFPVQVIFSIMVSLSPSGKVALDRLVVRCFNFVIITKLQLLTLNHINALIRQVRVIEEKKLPCVTYGVSTVDDEEIYFNYGGFNSVDDPASGEVNKDSIFRICSQTKLITHACYSRNFYCQ